MNKYAQIYVEEFNKQAGIGSALAKLLGRNATKATKSLVNPGDSLLGGLGEIGKGKQMPALLKAMGDMPVAKSIPSPAEPLRLMPREKLYLNRIVDPRETPRMKMPKNNKTKMRMDSEPEVSVSNATQSGPLALMENTTSGPLALRGGEKSIANIEPTIIYPRPVQSSMPQFELMNGSSPLALRGGNKTLSNIEPTIIYPRPVGGADSSNFAQLTGAGRKHIADTASAARSGGSAMPTLRTRTTPPPVPSGAGGIPSGAGNISTNEALKALLQNGRNTAGSAFNSAKGALGKIEGRDIRSALAGAAAGGTVAYGMTPEPPPPPPTLWEQIFGRSPKKK